MTKSLFIACVICNFINLSCAQRQTNKNWTKVEVNPEVKDDFFNSHAYSQSPSSMTLRRNDTLVLDTTYALITEKEINAFIEDQYNKKFDLDNCFGKLIEDTMSIKFTNDLIKDNSLSIKIYKGYFTSSFSDDSSISNSWTPVKERLVLNTINLEHNHEVRGLLEIEFVLFDNGVKKDSAFFHGPFYFHVSVPPIEHSYPANK